MVFYETSTKPLSCARSTSINSNVCYAKPPHPLSPVKSSYGAPVKQTTSPQKHRLAAPRTPTRVMIRNVSQRLLTKKSETLPFRDFPTNQVSPTRPHRNNIEFGTLEGLSSPSVQLDDTTDEYDLHESTTSLYILELNSPTAFVNRQENNQQTGVVSMSSWSNLDFLYDDDDEKCKHSPEKCRQSPVKKSVKPSFLPRTPKTSTKEATCDISLPVLNTESPTRRLPQKMSKSDLSSHRDNPSPCRQQRDGRRKSEQGDSTSMWSPMKQLRKQVSVINFSSPTKARTTVSCSQSAEKFKVAKSSQPCNSPSKILPPVECRRSPLRQLRKHVSTINLMSPTRTTGTPLSCRQSAGTFNDAVPPQPSRGCNSPLQTLPPTECRRSPLRQLRKHVSAINLLTPTRIRTPLSCRQSAETCNDTSSSQPSRGFISPSKTIPGTECSRSPLRRLRKHVSAINLMSPTRTTRTPLSCRQSAETFNDILSSQPLQGCTSPIQNALIDISFSPKRQTSERIKSSPKWVKSSTTTDELKQSHAWEPKSYSVQDLLSEFEKIMDDLE